MTTSEPPPPAVTDELARSIISPVVQIIVGPKEVNFYLHSTLLCQKSECFRASLQGKFSEAVKGEVKLPDIEPETSQYFVKWLYTGDQAPFDESIDSQQVFESMVDVYALGDRVLCDDVKNRAVDMTQECFEQQGLYAKDVLFAAKATGPQSKLTQYLAEQIARDMVIYGYQSYLEEEAWLEFISLDGSMATDLLCKLKKWQEAEDLDEDPAGIQGCRWHEHKDAPETACVRWSKEQFRRLHRGGSSSQPAGDQQ